MNLVVWVLSEAVFPVSLGVAAALAFDIARHAPTRARHYRWRNRRFLKKLRSCHVSGGSGKVDRPTPLSLSALAGVEPPSAVQAPPAPCPLVGAVFPAPAPARPPRVMVHG